MRSGNLLSLFAISAVADIARYDARSGLSVSGFTDRYVDCNAVNGILGLMKEWGVAATQFCSSYLQIGTATVTNFVTPPPSLVTVVSATTVTVTTFEFNPNARRNAPPPKPVPGVLKAFAAAEITSACNCLQLASQTARATVTAAASVSTITALTTITTTFTTCGASGYHCDCDYSVCCNEICICSDLGGIVNTCL